MRRTTVSKGFRVSGFGWRRGQEKYIEGFAVCCGEAVTVRREVLVFATLREEVGVEFAKRIKGFAAVVSRVHHIETSRIEG